MEFLKGKAILVTGACGTVGQALVSRLLSEKPDAPAAVVGIDNNERGLFFLDQQFLDERRAQFVLADICDRESLAQRMRGIEVVFHTAALKHVVLCERSPLDTERVNVRGVQNVIETAGQAGVERVIFTSSDKAVNPVSVMGASKRAGERKITAAAENARKTIYASTRFGNVLGSSASVVPIFHRQIARGGPVTLTDPDMLRFVMSVQRSVELIIETAGVASGGEVFVTKMPVIRIQDLAEVMIRELAPRYQHNPDNIEIKVIGSKAGEKLHEELMSADEAARAIEMARYFTILPPGSGQHPPGKHRRDAAEIVGTALNRPYRASEQTLMDQDSLSLFLHEAGLLEPVYCAV